VLRLLILTAEADVLGDAVADLNDALHYAEEDGRHCGRHVVRRIENVIDDLHERTSSRALRDAIEDLKRAEDAAMDCERRVNRRIRSAIKMLRRALAAHKRDAKPKYNPPKSSWDKECIETWIMAQLAEISGDQKAVSSMTSMTNIACGPGPMGNTNWPNGATARSGSSWYYSNGATGKSGSSYYYPNGATAKSGSSLYYPNGATARAGSSWYYPNGNRAGGAKAIEGWSCAKNAKRCQFARNEFASDIPLWRDFALLRLVWETR
jgi:hypothetical protein